MQIMPVSRTGNTTAEKTAASQESGRDNLDFMKILSSALEDTPAEISPVLDAVPSYTAAAADDSGIPLASESADEANSAWSTVEAPYSSAPTTLETPPEDTPVEDIRFTDSELADVIKNLREQGVDDETLARVAELMNRPGGTTAKEIQAAVMGTESAKLTDADLQRISSFLDRIDPSGQYKTSIMDDLKAGKTFRAFENMEKAMRAMADDSKATLNLDKNEILSLGKALRLGDDAMKSLEKAFGGKESLRLGAKEARELLAPMNLEMQKQEKNLNKSVEVLANALQPAVDKARKRLKAEADAAGQRSRRTEQSETLIRDTVTREGLNKAADTATRAAEKAEASAQKADASKTAAESAKEAAGKQASRDATPDKAFAATNDAKAAADTKAKKAEVEKATTDKLDARTAGAKADAKDDPWEALLSKLEVRTNQAATVATANTPNTRTESAQPLASTMNLQSAQNATQTARTVANAPTTSARVLSQVEQGVFSALADGTKRLTLNLNPVELGAVSVILSSRNGEVSALLKPEKAETAAVLAQQADALRQSLEQQGIKVDKVDVQTPQEQRQNASQWQGTDSHNASQEQQSRRDALDRMRRLGRMRESDPVTFAATTQAMRHSARAANSSGVSIIA